MAKSRVVIEIETDVKTAFEHAGWSLFNQNTIRINSGDDVIGYNVVSVTPIAKEPQRD